MSSLRKQIRDYLANLALPLREQLTLRADPTWTNNPLQHLDAMPSLQLFAGDDTPVATDNRGRTKQFEVTFKFCFNAPRADLLEDEADDYIAAITTLVEGDIRLGGLADILDARRVESFIDTLSTPRAIVLVTWRVQYRHLLAQPEVTY